MYFSFMRRSLKLNNDFNEFNTLLPSSLIEC